MGEGPHLVAAVGLLETLYTEVRRAGHLGSLLHSYPLGAGDREAGAGAQGSGHLYSTTTPPPPGAPLCLPLQPWPDDGRLGSRSPKFLSLPPTSSLVPQSCLPPACLPSFVPGLLPTALTGATQPAPSAQLLGAAPWGCCLSCVLGAAQAATGGSARIRQRGPPPASVGGPPNSERPEHTLVPRCTPVTGSGASADRTDRLRSPREAPCQGTTRSPPLGARCTGSTAPAAERLYLDVGPLQMSSRGGDPGLIISDQNTGASGWWHGDSCVSAGERPRPWALNSCCLGLVCGRHGHTRTLFPRITLTRWP